MKGYTDEDLVHNDICLFCGNKAEPHYSSHGRCFDGYFCYCKGHEKLRKAADKVNKLMYQVRENKELLEEKDKIAAYRSDIELRERWISQLSEKPEPVFQEK